MNWEITPFVGIGPVKLGMSIEEVSTLLGPPQRTRRNDGRTREGRARDLPMIHYIDDLVSEIEAFPEMENVSLNGLSIFGKNGHKVMRELEKMNGGARTSVGTVIFNKLGIATGRLDESVRGQYSLTVFRQGTWDDRLDRLTLITFG